MAKGLVEAGFSRRVVLDEPMRNGVTVEISADTQECAALARRFGLVAIDSLTATVTIEPGEEDHLLRLRGRFAADVTQSCGVTLEPVAGHVEGILEGAYSTDEKAAGAVRHMAPDADIEPGEDDLPEHLEGDEIDIGEVVAEHLGLHLDPYPRRPGVIFSTEDGEEPVLASPFAVLRELKTH